MVIKFWTNLNVIILSSQNNGLYVEYISDKEFISDNSYGILLVYLI